MEVLGNLSVSYIDVLGDDIMEVSLYRIESNAVFVNALNYKCVSLKGGRRE